METSINTDDLGVPLFSETSKWLFQLDDSNFFTLKSGCFTTHPLKNGCLEFQVGDYTT